jgi:hypothetical protein
MRKNSCTCVYLQAAGAAGAPSRLEYDAQRIELVARPDVPRPDSVLVGAGEVATEMVLFIVQAHDAP